MDLTDSEREKVVGWDLGPPDDNSDLRDILWGCG